MAQLDDDTRGPRPEARVVAVRLRPRPLDEVRGRSVAYFCTAPESAHVALAEHLRDAHDANVVFVSGALADRPALREQLPGVVAEVFLVELKAAAVDVVVEAALERGSDVVLAANDVVAADESVDLDEILLEVAKFP